MRVMKQSFLLFALLLLLVGCGKQEEAADHTATPQTQPKASAAKQEEPTTSAETDHPWDTPTRLGLFMARNIEDASGLSGLVGIAPDLYADNEGEQKASALHKIASALVEAEDSDHAVATLKQAVEVAQTIKIASNKADALTYLASALAKMENKELAVATSKQAVEAAQKIEEADKKVATLVTIASTQNEAGDKPQALVTLKQADEASQEESSGSIRDCPAACEDGVIVSKL